MTIRLQTRPGWTPTPAEFTPFRFVITHITNKVYSCEKYKFDSFDLSDSCHVTIVKITVINLKNTFYTKYYKKTFLNPDFFNFRA